MLSRRTMRGPSTGAFQMAVCTVLPCHVTSRGRPTLTESKRAITSFPRECALPKFRSLQCPLSVFRSKDHRGASHAPGQSVKNTLPADVAAALTTALPCVRQWRTLSCSRRCYCCKTKTTDITKSGARRGIYCTMVLPIPWYLFSHHARRTNWLAVRSFGPNGREAADIRGVSGALHGLLELRRA